METDWADVVKTAIMVAGLCFVIWITNKDD